MIRKSLHSLLYAYHHLCPTTPKAPTTVIEPFEAVNRILAQSMAALLALMALIEDFEDEQDELLAEAYGSTRSSRSYEYATTEEAEEADELQQSDDIEKDPEVIAARRQILEKEQRVFMLEQKQRVLMIEEWLKILPDPPSWRSSINVHAQSSTSTTEAQRPDADLDSHYGSQHKSKRRCIRTT